MNPPSGNTPSRGQAPGHDTIVKRSRGAHHDDEHGGNWKVAFADFCLALLCLFLLLWLMNAREHDTAQRRKGGVSRVLDGTGNGVLDGECGAVEERFERRAAGHGDAPSPSAARQDLRELAARLRKASEEAGLQDNLAFEITDSWLRVLLHDTDRRGVFRVGSATPDPRFRRLIRRLGGLFGESGDPVLVIGHTDARPYRRSGSNWHLSSERALASRDLLLAGGLPAATVLLTAGMADNALLVGADPLAAANRRIEFLVLGPAGASSLRRMFGMPENATPLMDGVDAVGAPPAGPI